MNPTDSFPIGNWNFLSIGTLWVFCSNPIGSYRIFSCRNFFKKINISPNSWDFLTTKVAINSFNNGLSYNYLKFFDTCRLDRCKNAALALAWLSSTMFKSILNSACSNADTPWFKYHFGYQITRKITKIEHTYYFSSTEQLELCYLYIYMLIEWNNVWYTLYGINTTWKHAD